MRVLSQIILLFLMLATFALFNQCGVEKAVTDTQKTAALRKVTVTSDSVSFEIGLPPGALSGKSFTELAAEDPVTYENPANYSVTISQYMTADNKQDGAEDAKFDGVYIDMVMDTLASTPVRTEAEGFEIKKNTTHPFEVTGGINLQTHRRVCLYIFRQTVDGTDLMTTMSPVLRYKIGSETGTIDLPEIQKNIPTRASDETKAFLAGLLDSGVFEE